MTQQLYNHLLFFLKISRPRFWLYTAGPFLLGTLFIYWRNGVDLTVAAYFLSMFAYFLIPANLLMYGVNDYFDWETDKLNPKKESKEVRVTQADRTRLQIGLSVIMLVSLLGTLIQPNILAAGWLFAFLCLAIGYSVPPFRFKARPFIDSVSNVFYIFPGFVAYAAATQELPPLFVVVAGLCWTAAMHLYSAIPDIQYDAKAGLPTTATVLGQKRALVLCMVLWIACATLLLWNFGTYLTTILLFVYPLIPAYHLLQTLLPKEFRFAPIEKAYWAFPFITSLIGAIGTVEMLVYLLR